VKFFRRHELQAWFKLADSTLAYATTRRPRRRPSKEVLNEQHQQQNADDIVDISYVGAKIPSRTFRILQEAVGAVTPPGD